jgi:hypothetical protein
MMSFENIFGLENIPWTTIELRPSAPTEEPPPCWINLEVATRILLSGSRQIRAALLDGSSHTTKAVTAKKDALLRAMKSGRVKVKGQFHAWENLYFLTRDLSLTREKRVEDYYITKAQLVRLEAVDFQSSFISFHSKVSSVQILSNQGGKLGIAIQSELAYCVGVTVNYLDLIREFKIGVARRRGAPEKFPWRQGLEEFLAKPQAERTLEAATQLSMWAEAPPSDGHLLKRWRRHMSKTSLK